MKYSLNYRLTKVFNMSIRILRFFALTSFMLITSYVTAESIEIHPDEKPYLDSIMDRLNIDRNKMIRSNNYNKESKKVASDYYKNFGDFKNLYYYDHWPYQTISFRTNDENKIVYMRVWQADLVDLREIKNFRQLKWLDIHVTKIENIEGIQNLKNLERLDFNGNDFVESISPIANLPELKIIDAGTSNNISDVSGLKNLPKLEGFYCISCQLKDISSLARMKSLVRLELGGQVEDITPLSDLVNIKILKIRSKELKSVDSISKLISLKEIELNYANVKKINIKNELPNLEEIHLSEVPLDEMPDLSKTPNLRTFFSLESNISNVNLSTLPSSIEELYIFSAKSLKSLPKIENLPSLEVLEINGSGLESLELGFLPKLKRIKMSETEITQLGDFSGLPSLEEIWLFDTKVKSLEPLLDAPNLWIIALNHTAKNIPNASLVKKAISKNRTNRYKKPEDQVIAREVYEQLLKEHQDSKPGGSRRRGR